jgi:protein transport protein SEC24
MDTSTRSHQSSSSRRVYPQQQPLPPSPPTTNSNHNNNSNNHDNNYQTSNDNGHTNNDHQNRPRIDPAQVPKPPSFTTNDNDGYPYITKQSIGLPPPPAYVRHCCIDDGNAAPNLLRSTVYCLPKDRGVWHSTGDLPLGLLCTPLAVPSQDCNVMAWCDGTIQWPSFNNDDDNDNDDDDDDDEHVVSYGAIPNAVPVVDQPPGRNDTMCGMGSYDVHGAAGTVEYQLPDKSAYCTRPVPVQPVHLYALDISHPYVTSYIAILKCVATELQRQYDHQGHNTGGGSTTMIVAPKIGICLVSALGIILRNKTDDRYLVMPDLWDDPYCPVPLTAWCYDVVLESAALETFLTISLPTELPHWIALTARHRTMDKARLDGLDVSCGGAALAFMADALAISGGRGTLLTGRRPNYGVGMFSNSSSSSHSSSTGAPLQLWTEFTTKDEQATADFYKTLADRCHQHRVALSVVFHTDDSSITRSLDVATMGELCRATCGNLVWILKDDWKNTLRTELLREALAFTGWDAVFKVRCSPGLSVKRFIGAKGKVIETMTESELELSCINHRTCICVELEHRVGGLSKDTAYLQTALLYTNQAGQRRVRVSTLILKVGNTAQDVFRSVDFSAQSAFLLRGVVDCVRQPTADARQTGHEYLYHRTIQMLAGYRRCSSSPATQLVLPERMQLLPLFTMSLLKIPMLRANVAGMPSLSVTNDERAYYAWHANQSLPAYPLLLAYPNVYRVDSPIEPQWQEATDQSHNGFLVMPDAEPPSMESFDDDGTYLLDDGLRLYLYFGPHVPDDVKASMIQNDPNLHSMVDQMRLYAATNHMDTRPTWPPLTLVNHPDVIYPLMVADASGGERDYMDFLVTLHRRIRENVKS